MLPGRLKTVRATWACHGRCHRGGGVLDAPAQLRLRLRNLGQARLWVVGVCKDVALAGVSCLNRGSRGRSCQLKFCHILGQGGHRIDDHPIKTLRYSGDAVLLGITRATRHFGHHPSTGVSWGITTQIQRASGLSHAQRHFANWASPEKRLIYTRPLGVT